MTAFKIANVLLSDTGQFTGCPNLLLRSTRRWSRVEGEPGAWLLPGGATHDFMTFFNGLSVQKWRRYTVARDFVLHLELKGGPCAVVQTRADSMTYYAEPVEGTRVELPASDEWRAADLPLEVTDRDAVVSFLIEAEGDVQIRSSWYAAQVDEAQVRDVELSLCTTTFKKEAFITRNIRLVRDQILGGDERIAGHFRMHVVDNGRTLDAEALSGGGVDVHPNPNVGGAGGFARGMIESRRQDPRATHVLLMDDDVLISPESIIRTFNLLSIVNDEYADAFVSGAMMNMDEPYVRWEEMGFIGRDGCFHPLKPVARMDVLHDVVDNECYRIPSYLPGCEDQDQHYAAWWYCCIPMSQIDAHGLPLPVFVRGDDVEYSRRCAPKFITMNGICIWHLSFHMRYNAAQERYQMTRNILIDQHASDFAPLSDFKANIWGMFITEMMKFNYADAELVCRAVEDFLKGPDWLVSDEARTAFLDANKAAEKTRPLSEMADELASLGVTPDQLTTWKIASDRIFTRKDDFEFRKTYNGQRLLPNYTERGKVAVIDHVGWALPAGKIQRAETLVCVDIPNGRASVRTIDRARFKEVHARFKAAVGELERRSDELQRIWSAALPKLTSEEFWTDYLGL